MNHPSNPSTDPTPDPTNDTPDDAVKPPYETTEPSGLPSGEGRDKHGLTPAACRDYEPDEVAKAMTAEIEKLKAERKTAPWPRNHEIREEIAALKMERSRYELMQMAKM